MYYYSAFGLKIASEIHFPELVEINENQGVDVYINLGAVPRISPESLVDYNLWIKPDQYLLLIEDVAYYFVRDGGSITVEPLPNADVKTLRIYLLCNAMTAIVYQKKMIPLHASGFMYNNGAILLVGDSGAGKSTTLAALSKKGYSIFTDDVCVLKEEQNSVLGTPSYPMMKLWENTFHLLNIKLDENNQIWPNTKKFGLFFHDNFISSWKKITKIVLIESSEEVNSICLKQEAGPEAFFNLARNTYRSEYVDPMNLSSIHFKMTERLLKQSQVFKIIRPANGGNTVGKIVSLIEESFEL